MRDNGPKRRMTFREGVRRMWSQRRGERALLITFWPRDYVCGQVYEVDGRLCRITRYFHAADYRFYEVWGRELHGPQRQVDEHDGEA